MKGLTKKTLFNDVIIFVFGYIEEISYLNIKP
jgi:hypothetical protein